LISDIRIRRLIVLGNIRLNWLLQIAVITRINSRIHQTKSIR